MNGDPILDQDLIIQRTSESRIMRTLKINKEKEMNETAKKPKEPSRADSIFNRVADIKAQSRNARELSEGIRNRIIGSPGKEDEGKDRPEPVCFFDKLGTELGDIFDLLKGTITLLQEIETTFAE